MIRFYMAGMFFIGYFQEVSDKKHTGLEILNRSIRNHHCWFSYFHPSTDTPKWMGERGRVSVEILFVSGLTGNGAVSGREIGLFLIAYSSLLHAPDNSSAINAYLFILFRNISSYFSSNFSILILLAFLSTPVIPLSFSEL